MSGELIYTSVPRGLKPGSRGFSTVAVTVGLSPATVERLESLSGYRPLVPASHPSAATRNPVNVAHYRLNVGGRGVSVLSRVAFAGLDYTQRSNKLAHHLIVDTPDQSSAGPAWLAEQPGVFWTAWDQEPAMLPPRPSLPQGDADAAPCDAWAAVAGDAGWAGLLAEAASLDPRRPCWVIAHPGHELLTLIAEAVALVPPQQRWKVTFSTYFTDAPGDATCAWRCVYAGTPAAQAATRAASGTLVIDLTQPQPLPAAHDANPWVARARTGAALPATVPDVAAAVAPDRLSKRLADAPPVAVRGGSIDLDQLAEAAQTATRSRRPSRSGEISGGRRGRALLLGAAACVVSAGLGALVTIGMTSRQAVVATTSSLAQPSPISEPSPQSAAPAPAPVAPLPDEKPAAAPTNSELDREIAVWKHDLEDAKAAQQRAEAEAATATKAKTEAQDLARVSLTQALQHALGRRFIDKTVAVALPPTMPAEHTTIVFPDVPAAASWSGRFCNNADKIDLVTAASMAFLPPDDNQPGYRITWHKNTSALIGGAKEFTIATLTYQKRSGRWELDVAPQESIDRELARVLYQQVRWMILQPGGTDRVFQLLSPAELALPLATAKSLPLQLPAAKDRTKPYASAVAFLSKTDWTAAPGDPGPAAVIVERRADDGHAVVRFTLRLTPVPGGVTASDTTSEVAVGTDWNARVTLFRSAKDMVDPLVPIVAAIAKDTDALAALATKNSPDDAKPIVASVDDWKKTLNERYGPVLAALSRMNDRYFQAYADVSDLMFLVTLNNGVVVAHLVPKAAASPDAAQAAGEPNGQ